MLTKFFPLILFFVRLEDLLEKSDTQFTISLLKILFFNVLMLRINLIKLILIPSRKRKNLPRDFPPNSAYETERTLTHSAVLITRARIKIHGKIIKLHLKAQPRNSSLYSRVTAESYSQCISIITLNHT